MFSFCVNICCLSLESYIRPTKSKQLYRLDVTLNCTYFREENDQPLRKHLLFLRLLCLQKNESDAQSLLKHLLSSFKTYIYPSILKRIYWGYFAHYCAVMSSSVYGISWTGLDWTGKTQTSKTRTRKTRTSKTRTSKTRTSKTRTSKTRTGKS